MKLSECTYGRMVIDGNLNVGFVKYLTYNCELKYTSSMSDSELLERTIPVVQFPSGKRAIHPSNLKPFK